jgi:glycolate oxidase iron-sulfur subunit
MYAKGLISGTLKHTRKNDAFFSECLLCRACVETCFSAVRTDDIVLAGRRNRRRLGGISPLQKYVFERLLPDPAKLGRFIRMLKASRWIGSPHIEPALRLFGWLGASIARTEQIVREIPDEFFRERLVRRGPATQAEKKVMLFVGCGTNFMFPHVGEATVMTLEALGYETAVVDHGCCGLPVMAHGELAEAMRLALENMRAFSDESNSIIVTDCSSCASFLKDYPKLFSLDDPGDRRMQEAERFSSRIKDIVELLALDGTDGISGLKDPGSATPTQTVSFHNPCHLSRYQKISHLARDAVRSLPGIDYVEMKQADWCCGGAGTFAFEHPELSRRILEKKIHNIKSSGAGVVLTTCPSCMMQIRAGIADANLRVRTAHLVEIFCECLSASKHNFMRDQG